MQLLNLKKRANAILRMLGKGESVLVPDPVFIIFFNCEAILYLLIDLSFIC